MISLDTFSLYVLICVLAPLAGAFTLSFIMIFERRFDDLQKEAIKLELEKELQHAQYHQLNQQIQPHFFFNTLNTMLSLARLDRKKELILGLEGMAKFFKFKYKTNEPLIKINAEVEYIHHYLDIQRLRFGDRLEVHQHIEPQIVHAMIPPFLLQTIVENAFKHGFEKYSGPAILKISIYKIDESLFIEIYNTFKLEPYNEAMDYSVEESGYGLKNIQNRLMLLFSEQEIYLKMTHIGDETLVKVKLPYTTV